MVIMFNLDGMDYVNALKYFTVSQKQGNILASFRLAQMHAHGLGTSKYCHLATSYFKTLIEKADWHVSWIRDAEEYYETSTKNTPWVYLLLASELGYELAQENAAWILDREPKTSSINGLVILDKPNIPSVNDYVALNLWNRAANQGNVDARVKVGEYHFYGRGITKKMDNKPKFSFFSSTEYGTPDYEKAALYYQVAGDEHSSLALWNLGYLYENGLGVAKDFHLAKRMYDLSLTTNPGGYLPVNLALFYLNIRQFWSSLFNEAVVESLDNGLPRIEGQEDEFDEFEVYEGYALQVLVMILVLLFSYRFLMARIVPGVIVPAVVNAQVNVEGEAVAVPAAKEGVDLAAVHANVPVVEEVAQTVVADQPDNHDAEHEAERMHAVFG